MSSSCYKIFVGWKESKKNHPRQHHAVWTLCWGGFWLPNSHSLKDRGSIKFEIELVLTGAKCYPMTCSPKLRKEDIMLCWRRNCEWSWKEDNVVYMLSTNRRVDMCTSCDLIAQWMQTSTQRLDFLILCNHYCKTTCWIKSLNQYLQ